MQGGKGGAMGFGRSKAKMMNELKGKVTFNDVAGVEEAKEEVEEIVEFLKDPRKFSRLGGKIPRGALLVGPPGTGKTLLARAIAGEAGVPFFTISGSDFVEMFVGVGASRVRDMFEQGKKNSPCIIFIDEIDAVGRSRGAGLGGGNDEREQTLNQLLVEMDGFDTNEGVIIIAATNRPDVLDPALLRPGRFDRQVVVSNPDIIGREKILKVHVKKMVMTEDEKKLTAYHEGGHALVSFNMPSYDPIHKATIIPRGRALGMVMNLPERDKHGHSIKYLKARLAVCFGGRVAEEVIFGKDNISTGAGGGSGSDINQATQLARAMVTKYGMSEEMGPVEYGENQEEVFLGRSVTQTQSVSEEVAQKIDKEIRKLIDEGYNTAKKILTEKVEDLHKIAKALMTYETLTGEEIENIINKNIYPADKQDLKVEDDKGSAMGALGLKPKIVH
jgi:cell division protease FtsH